MGVYLQWEGKALYFDITVSETHIRGGEVTEHPVEDGPDVADHFRLATDRVDLEVFVSNAPIIGGFPQKNGITPVIGQQRGREVSVEVNAPKYKAPFGFTPGAVFGAVTNAIDSLFSTKRKDKASVLTFDQPFNAPSSTYAVLRKLQDDRKLVKVVTPTWDYEGMLLERVEIPRSVTDGTGATIKMGLKEIRIVKSKSVDAPLPSTPRGNTQKTKGEKGVKEEDTGGKKESVLSTIAKKFGL